ncbi:hypothetical protein EMIT0196MI5_260020 [Pseudomonas sp. IT-196MI5]
MDLEQMGMDCCNDMKSPSGHGNSCNPFVGPEALLLNSG